jgi:hypothetical protein
MHFSDHYADPVVEHHPPLVEGDLPVRVLVDLLDQVVQIFFFGPRQHALQFLAVNLAGMVHINLPESLVNPLLAQKVPLAGGCHNELCVVYHWRFLAHALDQLPHQHLVLGRESLLGDGLVDLVSGQDPVFVGVQLLECFL